MIELWNRVVDGNVRAVVSAGQKVTAPYNGLECSFGLTRGVQLITDTV